jgi:outer membrane protein
VKHRLALTLLILSAGLFAQTTPRRLTLEEAEQIALRQNPTIRASEYEALAARQLPVQREALRRPLLDAGLSGVGAPDSNRNRVAAGLLNNPVIYSRLATGFSASQLLYDFGRTNHLIESARIEARAADGELDNQRNSVIFDVDRAYFEALRTEVVVRVARQTVEARQVVVDQVTELARARLKSGLDVSFATVSLAEAKLILVQAENDRRAAYASLSAAMGFDQPQEIELVDEPIPTMEILDLDELIRRAMANRPDLRALRLQAAAQDRLTRAERVTRRPSVSAMLTTGVAPAHVEAIRAGYAAGGVVINFPLLDGGAIRSRQAEAELRARAAAERVRTLETEVVRDVTVALVSLNTAAERLELTTLLVDQAIQALELAQSRYDLGLSSIVELSQAQLAQISAEIQGANARYDYLMQRRTLHFQTGILP